MSNTSKIVRQIGKCLAVVAAIITLSVPAANAAIGSSTENSIFSAAAQEFNVPESLLKAIAYNQSRFVSHGSSPSVDNGFGMMDLRTKVISRAVDGRGDPNRPIPKSLTERASHYTLDEAATILHMPADTLKTDDAANVRGAAAVLAQYAKQSSGGQIPTSINDWYSAVAAFSGAMTSQSASDFADMIFATLTTGFNVKNPAGQVMTMPAVKGIQPNRQLSALALPVGPVPTSQDAGNGTDCPRTLNCRFVSAGYAKNDPSDPANYGNFDPANRPHDMKIKYIYIHDTEGSYQSAIHHFQDTTSFVSVHYVIRSSDGAITEMVRPRDVSWGIGDWYNNMHGINIEHEGIAAEGATWYTEAMYKSSATLVRYLAHKYDVPLDRQHILGHDTISKLSGNLMTSVHNDPGAFWNWDHYMDLVRGHDSLDSSASGFGKKSIRAGDVVKIDPDFATNMPPVQGCPTDDSAPCVPLPLQPSNLVYLRTEPKPDAPLLSDPYLHPDGAPGTTQDNDGSASAFTGDEYVVAAVHGDWTGVWFGGKVGWLYNPKGPQRTAKKTNSLVITPKPGQSSAAVYGGAYPNASEFPPTIPDHSLMPIYTLPAGQKYTVGEINLPTDYFYDATIDSSLPDDHMIVRGQTKYYQIMFNHRIGYVKADEVVLKHS